MCAQDSDLNGIVDVRYTGGARMLLLIEVGTGRFKVKVPVLVSDLDLECKLWIKLRLAPMWCARHAPLPRARAPRDAPAQVSGHGRPPPLGAVFGAGRSAPR